ncbi:MAG TPA: type ISP restriction/modification enzyme, partial [Balneolaceae bacterium]|nr:type ISP restriction/modification enzyme [Balneolaceae bacterium]
GIKTDRDSLFIDYDSNEQEQKMKTLLSNNVPISFKNNYRVKDSSSYKITKIISELNFNKDFITPIQYRPFDYRYTYYDPKLISRPAQKVMPHIKKGSVALLSCRQQSTFDFQHIFITNALADICTVSLQTKETGYVFPLYLYPETNGQQTLDGQPDRKPNLDPGIVEEIASGLGLSFTPEKSCHSERSAGSECDQTKSKNLPEEGNVPDEASPDGPTPRLKPHPSKEGTFSPIDLLDYIYAVLHSPSYREKYKEFLKIDFPRVPYPEDAETFWQLVDLGGELRQIHLLEHPVVEQFITTYPVNGDNTITNRLTKTQPGFVLNDENENGNVGTRNFASPQGKVWINDEQYFGQVPKKAWEFYIGGYQPAQKWLKDRRDRTLSFEDIRHYQKIIVALMETDRIMGEIDEVLKGIR